MEIRILGPLEVVRDGAVVPLPGVKPKTLLTRLVLDAGRVVSVDALADALWPEETPANVAGTIQAYVSTLRRALGAEGASLIETRPPGYVLVLDGHVLDAARLEQLVEVANTRRLAGDLDGALDAANAALALFRGEPLAHVAFDEWTQAEILRLQELRAVAQAEAVEARLTRGDTSLVAELEALVAANPFRERLRGQLALALYRAGRQSDALRVLADGRRRLLDELGVDPGPELQRLELAILEHDPALLAEPSAPPPPAAEPSRSAAQSQVHRRERTALDVALRQVLAGSARTVLLVGDAGSGKSVLADDLANRARSHEALVGRGRAHDLEGAPALWPWTEAIRDLLDETADATDVTSPLRARLEPLLGEQHHAATTAAGGSESIFPTFDAVGQLVRSLARERPVVLVLDDMHWADRASVDLLAFLVRSLRGMVLLVACYRAHELDITHPLRTVGADVGTHQHVERLTVDPLDADETRALLVEEGATDPSPELVAAIHDRTGGNPFFVVGLLRQLRDEHGRIDPSRAAVPDTAADVVRRRIARLPAPAREVMELASYAPLSFATALPAELLDLDREVAGAVLDAAAAAGLIVELPGQPGHFRFSHDMIRHALYDAISQRRRAETHLRIGRHLEALAASVRVSANELAWHFAQAAAVGGAAEAVRWGRAAAEQASALQAHADATQHLRRTLGIVRRYLDDQRLECEILLDLAASARLDADPAVARAAQQRAFMLASQLGDDLLRVRAQSPMFRRAPS